VSTVKGRVVESTGSWYEVAIFDELNQTKGTMEARLPGRFRLEEQQVTNPVAVGDYVKLSLNEDGTCSIEEIMERENYITRQATHGRQGEQILAANIDQAFVVQSVRQPKIKEGFIDRFLVTCEAYQLKPVILINKMDLAGDKGEEYVNELIDLYNSLGYTILTSSIHDEASLENLKSHLKDKTSVFIGPSGVGKTSLLNHIDPNIDRKVADISEYSSKGKHTTTYAKLLPLHFGGYLVDTPGIREFGLVNIEPWELSLFFPEMIEPRQQCKFNNCTHSHEPKCGVIEAFENGEIDAGRYHSYLQMLDSLKK
jgi:ribosome biogenesis GTPase